VNEVDLESAVDWLGAGGIVAYPTETVWGLGVDACSEKAVKALRSFKGRDDASPVSILVTGIASLVPLGFSIGAAARRLATEFWPGPLTLVIGCRGDFAPGVARRDGAVGVRCSTLPLAIDLAGACEGAGRGPVTATSCNASGAPAARTRAEALRVRGGDERVRLLRGVPDAQGAAPSTVVDVSVPIPNVLRWGAIPEATLRPVLEELVA
jgi:L-threonylcarbamoyladenylate synthase